MLKNRNLTSLVAVLLSALMLLSLLTISAFADTDTVEDVTEESVVVTDGESEAPTEPATGDESDAETEAGTETGTETTATTTAATTTTNDDGDDEKKENLTRAIVNLVVGALILALAVVLIVKFRAKIPAWWKALKSECGKIAWCPKDKLKKNTLVVIIIIVLLAVVIGVLDFAFSKGILLLGDLIH